MAEAVTAWAERKALVVLVLAAVVLPLVLEAQEPQILEAEAEPEGARVATEVPVL